jgi:hypothetical protein
VAAAAAVAQEKIAVWIASSRRRHRDRRRVKKSSARQRLSEAETKPQRIPTVKNADVPPGPFHHALQPQSSSISSAAVSAPGARFQLPSNYSSLAPPGKAGLTASSSSSDVNNTSQMSKAAPRPAEVSIALSPSAGHGNLPAVTRARSRPIPPACSLFSSPKSVDQSGVAALPATPAGGAAYRSGRPLASAVAIGGCTPKFTFATPSRVQELNGSDTDDDEGAQCSTTRRFNIFGGPLRPSVR